MDFKKLVKRTITKARRCFNVNHGLHLMGHPGFDNFDNGVTPSESQQRKVVVSIIAIDNYDELMHNTDETKWPQLLAKIDRKINSWAGFTEGVLKRYESNKYMFIFEYRHLKSLEQRKFEILDWIKEINVGNRIPCTVSLGIGVNGASLADNFKFAVSSLDMALSRGGDQVVIKNGDKVKFFGGKTREFEKQTKVKARVVASKLHAIISQAQNILIMGHENADVDCLGASLGLYKMAQTVGKEAYIVLEKSNPNIDSIMIKLRREREYGKLFLTKSEAIEKANDRTLLIVVDTCNPAIVECPELLKSCRQIIVLDHHRRGTNIIEENVVLSHQEAYASSVCELITEILVYVGDEVELNATELEALYAGIVLDTKNFTFKTGVRTFEAAATLRKRGVDTVAVKQMFQNDFETYVNISDIVKDAEIISENIAISICPSSVSSPQLVAAQAADQLLNLAGLTTAFVLSEFEEGVHISGRSLGDINVQIILEKLGGGGHMTVAGVKLFGENISMAKQKLKTAIEEYLRDEPKDLT